MGMCPIEKCQLYQPKPAVVEIVDLNRTQPYLSNTVAQDARERVQRLQRKENTTEESLWKGHVTMRTAQREQSTQFFQTAWVLETLSKNGFFDSEKKSLNSART